MIREVIAYVLLGAGVLLLVACSAGLVVLRDTYQRIHLLTPAGTLAPLLIALSIGVKEGLAVATEKSLLIWLILLLAGPVLGHAIARAQNDLDDRGGTSEKPDRSGPTRARARR